MEPTEEVKREDTARDIILDAIEEIRNSPDGFSEDGTMRWSRYWLVPFDGLRTFDSKKERKKTAPDAIKLCDTVKKDFATLDNLELLTCHTLMVRQASKQM